MTDKGLCYVVPAYHAHQTEHFYHLPALLELVGEAIPLAVVVERGSVPIPIQAARMVSTIGGEELGKFRRAFRFLRVARRMARLGYGTFFLRYSKLATTLLLLLRIRQPIRIYYWASGQADRGLDERMPLRRRLAALAGHLYFRWLVRNVDVVVTGPESMVGYMSNRWAIPPEKMGLLYNDIDTRRFRPVAAGDRAGLRSGLGVSDDDFLLLFVHRLSERRGARLVVPLAEAMAEETGGRFRLIVVGDGPDASRLHHQIDRSRWRDVFDVRGSIPNRELPDLYQASDCFLMPSYEEGFPRVILEAMATAIPVVATRAGGTQDVLGADYPYTAEPGDVMSLVGHLSKLSQDPQLRQDVGTGLRRRAVQLYDSRVVADMLAHLVRPHS